MRRRRRTFPAVFAAALTSAICRALGSWRSGRDARRRALAAARTARRRAAVAFSGMASPKHAYDTCCPCFSALTCSTGLPLDVYTTLTPLSGGGTTDDATRL